MQPLLHLTRSLRLRRSRHLLQLPGRCVVHHSTATKCHLQRLPSRWPRHPLPQLGRCVVHRWAAGESRSMRPSEPQGRRFGLHESAEKSGSAQHSDMSVRPAGLTRWWLSRRRSRQHLPRSGRRHSAGGAAAPCHRSVYASGASRATRHKSRLQLQPHRSCRLRRPSQLRLPRRMCWSRRQVAGWPAPASKSPRVRCRFASTRSITKREADL
mmetsp:Transcript_74295/g.200332  ORF Transcript_74295/g.200332 Transcript_74295/m.200332 type:complete len:212 (+) Transcript_74295:107-742(+)